MATDLPVTTCNLRRRLLKVVGAFFVANALPATPAFSATPSSKEERRSFAAFLNVLLPRDVLSGSATDVQVDKKLWAFAQRDSNFKRLVVLGSQWLNMTGQGNFADLSVDDQIAVVHWMSTSDWNQIPRRFYELVRQAAIEIYYSDPLALGGLAIQAPPQPLGYPPPWQ